MEEFWVFIIVLFSIFCFFNICVRCCDTSNNRRRSRSSNRIVRVRSSNDTRGRSTDEEKEDSDDIPTVMAIYDNDYVNAEVEIIRNNQLSILEAVAIKRKREDECNEEWKETEMKQLSRNEDNEERKDECKFNHNASEGGMVRVTTEDVIVIQPTSPIVAEQV